MQPDRYYVIVLDSGRSALENLVGSDGIIVVASSGGKSILSNHPLAGSASVPQAKQTQRQEAGSIVSRFEIAVWLPSRFAACFAADSTIEKSSLLPLARSAIHDEFLDDQRTYSGSNHVYCI